MIQAGFRILRLSGRCAFVENSVQWSTLFESIGTQSTADWMESQFVGESEPALRTLVRG